MSEMDVAMRLKVLKNILGNDDGIGQLKRLLTDRSRDFDGVAPAQQVAQVLEAAVSSKGLRGKEAARLAVVLSEIKDVCAMDVSRYLGKLRERFPVECEEANLLAVEVMES